MSAQPILGTITALDVDGQSITFEYFERLDFAVTAEYEKAVVRGRSEPYRFYSGTSVRAWNFTLIFLASVDQGEGVDDATAIQMLQQQTDFFEACQYPIVNDDQISPPTRVKISCGKILNATGLISDVRTAFPAPFTSDGYTMRTEISFMFEEINDKPLDAITIFNRSAFPSASNG
jgi:hypothetical protein